MDNYDNRRLHFWDNWWHSLSATIDDIDAQSSGKWCDDNDTADINAIKIYLQGAKVVAMKHFHSVLGAHLDELNSTGNQEAQS